MTPIQEMEKNHSRLEKLVKKRTKELDDVIATNHRFISILGHDLRSPFSTILGVLGLLKESFYDYSETEIEKFIDMAIESANRTLTLLDELLAWSYAQNMGKSISPLKVNLIEVIQAEIMNFSVIAQQKEIILTHTVPSGLNVTADLMMVKTILRNLINNAIKFTPRGGNISITASENSPFVEISVKDSGLGIAKDIQENLFKIDKFHSLPGTENEKGSGLGLLICKEFVTLHGGDIKIDSKPGAGSSFMFTLPHYL